MRTMIEFRFIRSVSAIAACATLALAGCVPAQLRTQAPSAAPSVTLQAGPMLGYSEMREVLLWAQTTGPAQVHFVYWDTAAPGVLHRTRGEMTGEEAGFTTRQVAAGLEPGRRYAYEVWVNGAPAPREYRLEFQTQALWQYRTDPPDFRVAIGSCFYVNEDAYDRPGRPYGGNYEILASIAQARPDVMLWLGDNTYYREVDWYSRSGMLHRYTHTRSLPELQPLLASSHHYATWDDHDFGPNNSDRSWPHKETALEVFRLFWGNPTYGVGGRPGVTTKFQWGDADFFLLDDRYYRTPNERRGDGHTILGEEQIQWLIDALAFSAAPFKIIAIGGQVLNPMAVDETYANVSPAERERLISLITEQGISGVMFLTGDRHFTELTRLERPGTYPLYDLTISPLTAGVWEGAVPSAGTVEGTLVRARNFALLDFSGPRNDRALRIGVHDSEGRELWTRTIRAAELRSPRPESR